MTILKLTGIHQGADFPLHLVATKIVSIYPDRTRSALTNILTVSGVIYCVRESIQQIENQIPSSVE